MRPVKFNERLILAIVQETRTGFFVKLNGLYTIPDGYRVAMEWRWKQVKLVVDRSIRGPSGESETWLWMRHEREEPARA